MKESIRKALAVGTERVIAWADVLDRINVFPVPDGDTGRNLVYTLSPLRRTEDTADEVARALMLSARGNSGNIASQFFTAVLPCRDLEDLTAACREGRDLAYGAVSDPKPGTMLSLFDALVQGLESSPPFPGGEFVERVTEKLEGTVRETTDQIPELRRAGVVDAGALGMFIFFDAALSALSGRIETGVSVVDAFKDSLALAEPWREETDRGFCLDVVVEIGQDASAAAADVYHLGESVVTMADGGLLKVHLHADNQEEIRERLGSLGHIVRWNADDLAEQTRRFTRTRKRQALHIMTDAAGSVTREEAADLGITLLDSYINLGQASLPETYVNRAQLFEAMRDGAQVSTAQASVLERHQCYEKALKLYPEVLYLCVGSVYTGNYQVAMDWKAENDPEDRLIVVDTGSASGRLGLAVKASAMLSLDTDDARAVESFARRVVEDCQEYVFLDKLQYLARGGRLSKTSAFFGDMLKMKPIITPKSTGAEKAGVLRSRKDQVDFALARLGEGLNPADPAWIMLEYTDNETWLRETVLPRIETLYPAADILTTPVSLTSAAHMGPGTWAVAFLSKKQA